MPSRQLPVPRSTFLECVRSHLEPRTPPALCHYTDQAGLLGILASRSLWASDLLCLNDSEEYGYGFKLVLGEVERRIAKNVLNADKLYAEVAGYYRPGSLIGIAAFTRLRDDLSQWRAYGRGSGGYALRFSGPNLRAAAIKSGAGLVPVLYRVADQRALVARYCDEALAELAKPRRDAATRDASSLKLYSSLFLVCAFIKAPAFRAEQEWRIVSFGYAGSTRTVMRARPGTSIVTPFIEVRVDNAKSKNPQMPLLDITVGPNPHPDLARRSVVIALRQHGQQAAVKSSTIPFRNW